jgi:DNA-binding LacI/PurR family transcriptional regulator
MSDRMALATLEAAARRGLSVPADVSVVGFDDIPDAARATPPLTTVRRPHVEKGRLAGELLIARLHGEEVTAPYILPTKLVPRGSTARPPDTLPS